MENQEKNKVLYSKCGFEISNIRIGDDCIDVFESLLPKFKYDTHPLTVVNERNRLKIKVQFICTDLANTTFVVRKNCEFVGFFVFRFKDEHPNVPIIDHVEIVKKFRKTKALACMIDFSMNYLYIDKNIQVEDVAIPGFAKIVYDHMLTYNISFVKLDTRDRVKRICNKCRG